MEKLFGMESIAFQTSAFFNDLVKACQRIRSEAVAGTDAVFFKQPVLVELTQLIQAYTGLKVEWDSEYGDAGPMMITPLYSLSHIFYDQADREDQAPELDASIFIKHLNKPLYQGTIDLVHAKVTGDFCEIRQRLAVPQTLLAHGRWNAIELSCEETAAVLLHEVGHAFIELEFLDRVVTTNQVLSGLSESLLETDVERKKLAYSTAALRLRLDPKQKKALEDAQNDDSLTVIMATLAVEKSRSELGDSVFDMTACEHLADQFAARHGSVKYLITALSKISTRQPVEGYGWRWTRDAVLYGVAGLILLPLSLLVLFNAHLYSDRYGSLHTRTLRLQGEIIQRLKNRKLAPEERRQLLEAEDTANKVLDSESLRLTFFESVAMYVNSSYRHQHDYRLLQQKLEGYANNSLFGHAARLAAL
jgi:hypothetical protein